MQIHNPDVLGAVALAGDEGVAGQFLQSGGPGAQAAWGSAGGSAPVVVASTAAMLALFGSYQPGTTYLVGPLTQGTLGSYLFAAQALSATRHSEAGKAFPTGYASGSLGWEASMNWAAGQLYHVADNRGNQVYDAANIAAFKWFSGNYTGNLIASGATFIPTTSNATFSNNRVVDGAFVSFSAITGSANISGNTWANGAMALDTPSIICSGNLFQQTQIVGTATAQPTFNNNLFVDTVIAYGGNGNLLCSNSTVLNSNLNATGDCTWNISHCALSSYELDDSSTPGIQVDLANVVGSGTISATGSIQGVMEIRNVTMAPNSTISLAGITTNGEVHLVNLVLGPEAQLSISNADFRLDLTGVEVFFGQLTLSVNVADISISSLWVENGTLINNGFEVQNSRLQGADSTLIANVMNATKTGYVGVLP